MKEMIPGTLHGENTCSMSVVHYPLKYTFTMYGHKRLKCGCWVLIHPSYFQRKEVNPHKLQTLLKYITICVDFDGEVGDIF